MLCRLSTASLTTKPNRRPQELLDATTGSPGISRLYGSTSYGTSQACCFKAILFCSRFDEYFACLSHPLDWCHPVPSTTAGGSASKTNTHRFMGGIRETGCHLFNKTKELI